MSIDNQIQTALNRIDYKQHKRTGKWTLNDPDKKLAMVESICNAYSEGKYDFANLQISVLNQMKKKRRIAKYADLFDVENVLCQCVKQILDKNFNVKYPNRNAITHDFFSYVRAIHKMSHFTIVRMDFKDYFNSVSASYVFHKYLKNNIKNRDEADLVGKYTSATRMAYAGLAASNSIAEIIAQIFDDEIKNTFFGDGLIFYERYVDDAVLMFNCDYTTAEVKLKINELIEKVYCGECLAEVHKCRTKLNAAKFQCVSKKDIIGTTDRKRLDFLGYEFVFFNDNMDVCVQYGITEEKQRKYMDRLKKIILRYAKSSKTSTDAELLRQRIKAFLSRTVYNGKYFRSNTWKAKGFISNYGELRYLLGTKYIDPNTENFLKTAVEEAFRLCGISAPYYLNHDYCLWNGMKKNQSLVLVEGIGYDYRSLEKLCLKAGITVNVKRPTYDNLVREYLIAMFVGY